MAYKFSTSSFRSALMQKIKSEKNQTGNCTQERVTKKKIRFQGYNKKLSGKPDIVLLEKKVVIFIDGEFWHGYKWKGKREKIKANRDYWIPKIERTIERDRKNNLQLKKLGWSVLRFWGHEIKRDIQKCIRKTKRI